MIPWRYIVPVHGYRRMLRIGRACPEIVPQLNRYSRTFLLGCVLWALLFVPMLLLCGFIYLGRGAERALDVLQGPRVGRRLHRIIEECHEIVPVNEMRRRIGEPPLR